MGLEFRPSLERENEVLVSEAHEQGQIAVTGS
jgi:hypothetical protein